MAKKDLDLSACVHQWWWNNGNPACVECGVPAPASVATDPDGCPYCDDGDYIDHRNVRHRCMHCDGTNRARAGGS